MTRQLDLFSSPDPDVERLLRTLRAAARRETRFVRESLPRHVMTPARIKRLMTPLPLITVPK